MSLLSHPEFSELDELKCCLDSLNKVGKPEDISEIDNLVHSEYLSHTAGIGEENRQEVVDSLLSDLCDDIDKQDAIVENNEIIENAKLVCMGIGDVGVEQTQDCKKCDNENVGETCVDIDKSVEESTNIDNKNSEKSDENSVQGDSKNVENAEERDIKIDDKNIKRSEKADNIEKVKCAEKVNKEEAPISEQSSIKVDDKKVTNVEQSILKTDDKEKENIEQSNLKTDNQPENVEHSSLNVGEKKTETVDQTCSKVDDKKIKIGEESSSKLNKRIKEVNKNTKEVDDKNLEKAEKYCTRIEDKTIQNIPETPDDSSVEVDKKNADEVDQDSLKVNNRDMEKVDNSCTEFVNNNINNTEDIQNNCNVIASESNVKAGESCNKISYDSAEQNYTEFPIQAPETEPHVETTSEAPFLKIESVFSISTDVQPPKSFDSKCKGDMPLKKRKIDMERLPTSTIKKRKQNSDGSNPSSPPNDLLKLQSSDVIIQIPKKRKLSVSDPSSGSGKKKVTFSKQPPEVISYVSYKTTHKMLAAPPPPPPLVVQKEKVVKRKKKKKQAGKECQEVRVVLQRLDPDYLASVTNSSGLSQALAEVSQDIERALSPPKTLKGRPRKAAKPQSSIKKPVKVPQPKKSWRPFISSSVGVRVGPRRKRVMTMKYMMSKMQERHHKKTTANQKKKKTSTNKPKQEPVASNTQVRSETKLARKTVSNGEKGRPQISQKTSDKKSTKKTVSDKKMRQDDGEPSRVTLRSEKTMPRVALRSRKKSASTKPATQNEKKTAKTEPSTNRVVSAKISAKIAAKIAAKVAARSESQNTNRIVQPQPVVQGTPLQNRVVAESGNDSQSDIKIVYARTPLQGGVRNVPVKLPQRNDIRLVPVRTPLQTPSAKAPAPVSRPVENVASKPDEQSPKELKKPGRKPLPKSDVDFVRLSPSGIPLGRPRKGVPLPGKQTVDLGSVPLQNVWKPTDGETIEGAEDDWIVEALQEEVSSSDENPKLLQPSTSAVNSAECDSSTDKREELRRKLIVENMYRKQVSSSATRTLNVIPDLTVEKKIQEMKKAISDLERIADRSVIRLKAESLQVAYLSKKLEAYETDKHHRMLRKIMKDANSNDSHAAFLLDLILSYQSSQSSESESSQDQGEESRELSTDK